MTIEKVDSVAYEKRICLGLGTQVNVKIDGVEVALTSEFVGMEEKEYLILKFPKPFRFIKHKLFPGNLITIEYVYRGTIYAFQTRLFDTIDKPIKLLFLEYPKIIQLHDLRSHNRMDCFIPAKIKIGKHAFSGVIMDISDRGCRWHSKELTDEALAPILSNEKINLICQFPGMVGELEVLGKAKNIKKNKQEKVLGFVFQKGSLEAQKMITQYIFSAKDYFRSKKV